LFLSISSNESCIKTHCCILFYIFWRARVCWPLLCLWVPWVRINNTAFSYFLKGFVFGRTCRLYYTSWLCCPSYWPGSPSYWLGSHSYWLGNPSYWLGSPSYWRGGWSGCKICGLIRTGSGRLFFWSDSSFRPSLGPIQATKKTCVQFRQFFQVIRFFVDSYFRGKFKKYFCCSLCLFVYDQVLVRYPVPTCYFFVVFDCLPC